MITLKIHPNISVVSSYTTYVRELISVTFDKKSYHRDDFEDSFFKLFKHRQMEFISFYPRRFFNVLNFTTNHPNPPWFSSSAVEFKDYFKRSKIIPDTNENHPIWRCWQNKEDKRTKRTKLSLFFAQVTEIFTCESSLHL